MLDRPNVPATTFATTAAPVRDLDGPCLVFGGPLGNLAATQALRAEADRLGIPPRRVICTGDVVAFGADPVATAEFVRDWGIVCLRGEGEARLAGDEIAAESDEGGPADGPGAALDHARAMLPPDLTRWLAALPDRVDVRIGTRRLAIVNGAVSDPFRPLFASTRAAEKRVELDRAGTDGIVAGRSGLPFTQLVDGRLWHNPGAIGLPAGDGTPRVWFAVLLPQGEGIAVRHHALAYDAAGAAGRMRAAGRPAGHAAALETGLRPDVADLPADEIRRAGRRLEPGAVHWPAPAARQPKRRGAARIDRLWPVHEMPSAEAAKFQDPEVTAAGEPRASVGLHALRTLWFNTGTLCNLTCEHCYIESSPRNDRLVYLTRDEVVPYLDEIARDGLPTEEIGLTGGEPFLNPEICDIVAACLERGFRVLVLTNAMKPMTRHRARLLELREEHGDRLCLRVSLDHYTRARHEEERGPRTWQPTLDGLVWLAREGFPVSVAGRTMWGEDPEAERQGYARLFREHGLGIDADDPASLVLFPEMDPDAEVPEITTACWGILGKRPQDVMCATSRMVVKRKGADRPAVLACTLLAYDPRFELGTTLREAARPVPLVHRHCAKFCVLGGASCSAP